MWGATTWLKADDSGAWYARRTPKGPGTIHARIRDRELRVEAWGDGAQIVLDDVPALFGLDDPGVSTLPDDPRLRELRHTFSGLRVGRSGQVFPRLIAAAVAQKVTGKNAKPALRRIAWEWGEQAPGPREDLRLLPEPRTLAQMPYYRFHPLNLERHRADLVRRIADRAVALERAARMPFPEARAHLEKLRGIGPWTSGVVMGGPLGDRDAVPLADIHLPNLVAWNLAREDRATDARMMELLEPFAGHRGLVARMLKVGGAGAPRYGPRATPRDIRGL